MDRCLFPVGKAERLSLFLVLCELLVSTFGVRESEAHFLGRLSISGAEEYTDNLFFSQKKEKDFITTIAPTLSVAYKPLGQPVPNFMARLSVPAQFFAQHSDLNNFGDNLRFDANY